MRTLLWSMSLFSSVIAHKDGVRVGLDGQVSFQLLVFDPADRTWKDRSDGNKESKEAAGKDKRAPQWQLRGHGHDAEGVTAAEQLDCVYQYPEQRHLDAMLGAIMNRLTKLFMRMRQLLNLHRDVKKRFRVVDKRDMFFDRIYTNMSIDFRQSVNKTRSLGKSALAPFGKLRASDPCAHQKEIRALWGRLLHSSEKSLGRAALACIEEYLRTSRAEGSGSRGQAAAARRRAADLIRRELRRVRNDQLGLLCDRFQLCYHDLQKARNLTSKGTTTTKVK